MKNISGRTIYVALACISTLCALGSVQAHHSFARFDFQKNVPIEGVVTAWQWTNPHSWLYLAVADGKGGTVKWGVEGNSPNTLIRFGLKKNIFKAGDKVSVDIHPDRDLTVTEGSFVKVNSINGVPYAGKGFGDGAAGDIPKGDK
jgi:Family of unknown function (DUF6152)